MTDILIERPLYIQRLTAFKETGIIKVLTGIRRCGKSKVLELYKKYLLDSGVDEKQIIYMNFERLEFDDIRDYKALYNYILEKAPKGEHCYLLLDEIQCVEHFEKAVASLNAQGNYDITLTGSNAYLLSGELATLLSGRYVEIKVYPLSFREYLDFSPLSSGESYERKFSKYLKTGAFPFVTKLLGDEYAIDEYLQSIYHTVLIKDIISFNTVKNPVLLQQLIKYVAQTTGNYLSANKISGYLSSSQKGSQVKSETISNYLSLLENAYVAYPVARYDIRGKELLKTQAKYYIADTGLRNTLLGSMGSDIGAVLESVVFFELMRRGYQVFVGKCNTLEVDFIALKRDAKLYVQVCESLAGEDVKKRELAPLVSIHDNYSKMILTMDTVFESDIGGVKIANIIDFLLEEY